MKLIFIIILNFGCVFSLKAQDTLFKKNYHLYREIYKNGCFYECSVPTSESDTVIYRNFSIKGHSDMILHKEYHKNGNIAIIGYYKLVYVGHGGYCWYPDMLWFYFNRDGSIKKEVFYFEGDIIEAEEYYMPPAAW